MPVAPRRTNLFRRADARQVVIPQVERRHAAERLQPRPIRVVAGRGRVFGKSDRGGILPQHDKACRISERQRAQQHRVHDAEDRSRRTDAESQGADGHNGERGTARQQAQRIVNVLDRRLDAAQTPDVAAAFDMPRWMAEPCPRLAPGGVGRHATLAESRLPKVDVQAHLFLEVGLELASRDQGTQATPELSDRHATLRQAGWSTRSMAWATRR